MRTQTITANRMASAGVPFDEAHWYFTVGRPRGFRGPGDAQRATNILQKVVEVKH